MPQCRIQNLKGCEHLFYLKVLNDLVISKKYRLKMAKFEFQVSCENLALCVFDNTALPNDFDTLIGVDPIAYRDLLQDKGKIWIDELAQEGQFVCHVYVDEHLDVSTKLKSRILNWSEPTMIDCSGGNLWICGAEYLAKEPRIGSEFTPKGGLPKRQKGKHLRLRRGVHSLCVIRLEKEAQKAEFLSNLSWIEATNIILIMLTIATVFTLLISAIAFVPSFVAAIIEAITGQEYCECRPARLTLSQQFGILLGCALMTGLAISISNAFGRLRSVRDQAKIARKKQLASPDFIFDIKTAKFLGLSDIPMKNQRAANRLIESVTLPT
jgi:hypothetical protein